MKEDIKSALLEVGVAAVGFAKAGKIDADAHESFRKWIGEGCNGEMAYLERHIPLRLSTENVLPGAKTVINVAFSYAPEFWRKEALPYVASYAYGEDYHVRLREILNPLISGFRNKYGGKWRICIDSAPVAERFWAVKSGIGVRGLNGAVIIKGAGALCFLVEILTTLEMAPDEPSCGVCDKCGRCVQECPAKALRGDGTMDARKCLNYITIEKKGEFNEEESRLVTAGTGTLFGCDRCLRICPHNYEGSSIKSLPNSINGGKTCRNTLGTYINGNLNILEIKPEDILSMTAEEFKNTFTRSPLAYAGYDRLRRNALAIKNKRD